MNQEEKWLVLSQYSQKYSVSVSTLRRWIKKERISFKLVDHKYYIKDEAPMGQETPGEIRDTSMTEALKELLQFCQGLIQEKERIYQEIIKDKNKEMISLKERVSEQKMLIRILEDKLHISSTMDMNAV
jgi:hypothetical protein